MSKKVLVISSSPRRGGNSDILCDEFLKGAQEAGHSVEKVFLKDKKINYCSGCGFCNTNGQTMCSQKDDMQEILDKIIEADVIVLATPVYFYTMCGQLKTFIDRCCARYLHINNKEFYYLMTAAENSKSAFDRVIEEFRGFLYCLSGAKEKEAILAPGVWNLGDINDTDYITQAFNMGKSV